MAENQRRLDQYVGGRIRARREALKLSLEQLAAAVGMSPSFLSSCEQGHGRPDAEILLALSQALAVPLSYFYDGLLEASACPPLRDESGPEGSKGGSKGSATSAGVAAAFTGAALAPTDEDQANFEAAEIIRSFQRIKQSPHRKQALKLLDSIEDVIKLVGQSS